MAKKLIVGNWKLNPQTVEEGERIKGISRKIPKNLTVVICPPAVFLSRFTKKGTKNPLKFGVQDVYFEQSGAFTGEYSPKMVLSVGALYSIVGHSERRVAGETSVTINKKVIAALKAGLTVILCVGEKERDHHGHYLSYLKGQIDDSLLGITKTLVERLIIAYEPLWTIGPQSQGAMEPNDLHETSLFIRKVLHGQFGKSAFKIPVLYGGSVDPVNTARLVKEGNVDGLLVGRESIRPEHFLKIILEVASL